MKKNQIKYPFISKLLIRYEKHFIGLTAIFIFCLLTCESAISQQSYYTIKGKVIDKNSKSPLQAASVFAQNTTFGVATDAEGNFTIKLPTGGYSLIVTYTGYETQSMRVSNNGEQNDNLVIEMSPRKNRWKKYLLL